MSAFVEWVFGAIRHRVEDAVWLQAQHQVLPMTRRVVAGTYQEKVCAFYIQQTISVITSMSFSTVLSTNNLQHVFASASERANVRMHVC